MRCFFWNIRGIANERSQIRLSKLIKKWDPDIVGIAEPKIHPKDIPINFLHTLGMSTVFFSNIGTDPNRVPNIWLIWKSSLPSPNMIYFSNQHITVEIENVLISIVHAHCTAIHRRQLWLELSNINPLNLPWMIMGDFNAYLSISEKKGADISSLGGIDKSGGLKFWASSIECYAMQAGGFNFLAGNTKFIAESAPTILRYWGGNLIIPQPKNRPFKFFNMWCTHPTFRDTVSESWQIPIQGNSIFILTQKLKRLKGILKEWNKDIFGNIKVKVEEETKKLEQMQDQESLEPC
ncbi:hypothetical protein IFM89_038407 [Coptis chinensis]|uniref:Endonuclease/exonuclease/phosphatase domain-containing protein n=1 Tax=Coptis chinensis TaxID=261450 RepID=A0A835HBI8_9MAGN|nr:hypothetical protein IFM89_038407 [Coptis chinensis]